MTFPSEKASGVRPLAARAGRGLSRTFTAALPYVVGRHGITALFSGSWELMKKVGTWWLDGDAVQVFAPGRAARRAAAQPAAPEPKKTKKGGGSAKAQKGGGSGKAQKGGGSAKGQKGGAAAAVEPGEPPARLLRAAALGGGAFAVYYFGAAAPVWSVSAGVACWCLLAWTYAPPAARSDGEGQGAAGTAQQAPQQRPLTAEETAAEFLRYVEHAVAKRWCEGVRGTRQGVHVEDLVADLKSLNRIADPRWDTAALAAYLRALGIPLRDPLPLTVNGKKVNRIGVHRDDLARYLGRAPLQHLPPVPDRTHVEEYPDPADRASAAADPGPRQEVLQGA